MPFEQYLPLQTYAMLMVFARVGTAILLMPGIGETFVTMRTRLFFAVALTFLVAPVAQPVMPTSPPTVMQLISLMAGEMLIGLYFGTIARLLLLTLDTTGRVISFSTGLANAQVFNPGATTQGSIPGALLTMLGILLLFETGLDHVFILAVADSYSVFTPGMALPMEDFANSIARLVGDSFRVAIQLASPFIIINLILFVALGMMARLMPQLQIFFVALPIQVTLGLLVLSVILTGLFSVYLSYYSNSLTGFLIQQ